jgi:glutamate/tyrosine decarboxylase-like PLP-dependent enzyme
MSRILANAHSSGPIRRENRAGHTLESMTAPYQDLVAQLRTAFPTPVSDRVHDAYFVFSFLRALDQVDGLKSAAPMLGSPVTLDYDAARRKTVADDPSTLEAVTTDLVQYLSGMFIWGHPRAQINVVPSPTIPSIIGGLLPSIYNPNLVSEESSRQVSLAEVEAIAMTAALVGYDPAVADGVFTFGGTGTLLYGAKIGLEKAVPDVRRKGLQAPAVLVCSDRAHYACLTIANWLGLGEENIVSIPTTDDNQMIVSELAPRLRAAIAAGRRIACIVATMGTTDAFGLDDLEGIVRVRDEIVTECGLDYVPHVHADAVIGWAWSVFNDYDFEANPLGFKHRTVRALAGTSRRIRHLGMADSIGIDYHKTGFAPYISSSFILKNGHDFAHLTRRDEDTPYIFQSGTRHPGKYTLETTRAGSGPLAAMANLKLFGRSGLQALLGHLVSMAEELRDHLEAHSATTVMNGDNFGPVTLVRVYPDGVDTFSLPTQERTDPACRETLLRHNQYNRRIFELIQADALQGKGVVISLTDCYRKTDYGEPINALKSYILSPFSDEQHVNAVLESIWKARAEIRGS